MLGHTSYTVFKVAFKLCSCNLDASNGQQGDECFPQFLQNDDQSRGYFQFWLFQFQSVNASSNISDLKTCKGDNRNRFVVKRQRQPRGLHFWCPCRKCNLRGTVSRFGKLLGVIGRFEKVCLRTRFKVSSTKVTLFRLPIPYKVHTILIYTGIRDSGKLKNPQKYLSDEGLMIEK